MILINRFRKVTQPWDDSETEPESETEELSISEPVGFRELVNLMRQHGQCSCSPASGSTWEWFSSESEPDYRTGESSTDSMHYSHDNPARNAKYWVKAMRAAGYIRASMERV